MATEAANGQGGVSSILESPSRQAEDRGEVDEGRRAWCREAAYRRDAGLDEAKRVDWDAERAAAEGAERRRWELSFPSTAGDREA